MCIENTRQFGTDKTTHAVRFLSGCRSPRANRPDRLIRDHDIQRLLARNIRECCTHLCCDMGIRFTCITLLQSFTDAANRANAMPKQCAHLSVHGFIRFPELHPPLRVPDDTVLHEFLEHKRRDFAGECAFIRPVTILRAQEEIGLFEVFIHECQPDEWRAQHDLCPLNRLQFL